MFGLFQLILKEKKLWFWEFNYEKFKLVLFSANLIRDDSLATSELSNFMFELRKEFVWPELGWKEAIFVC